MLRLDASNRSPLRTYLISRAVIWALAVVTVVFFSDRLNPIRGTWDSARLHELGDVIDVWARWDSDWYVRIAEGWYEWPSATPAFFPLYPAAVGALGRVFAGHYVLAGVAISLIAGSAAAVLVHRLARRLLDEGVAERTVVYLALFPTSLFLSAVYTESLFLLLAVSTFVLAERGRLGWAGVLAGLAILTRSQGLALLPALAWFAWRSGDRVRGAAAVAVALGMFGLYPLMLWLTIGEPFAFMEAQREVWQRSFDLFAPVSGPVHGAADGETTEALFAAVMLPLALASFRLVGIPYGLYATGVLWLSLTFPTPKGWLYSFPRLCLVAFPCLIALACLTARPRLHLAVSAVLATGLAAFVVRWALWEWVA